MGWTILLILLALVVARFIIYFTKLQSTKKYFRLYEDYIQKPTFEFHQHGPQIVQLFKDADLSDFQIHRIEPVGYGKLRTINTSGYANITLIEADVVGTMRSKFNEAIGVFRHRMLQSINPLFWLEFAFKLPQFLFEFVGVLPDKIVVKVALIIYWLVALFLGLKKFDLIDQLIK